jgi:hypothetical protein
MRLTSTPIPNDSQYDSVNGCNSAYIYTFDGRGYYPRWRHHVMPSNVIVPIYIYRLSMMCICERVHTHTYRLFYANDLYRLNRVPVYCIRRHSTHWWCIHGSPACVTATRSVYGVGTDVLISVWYVWWCHAWVTHDIHSCTIVDITRYLPYIHIVRIRIRIRII